MIRNPISVQTQLQLLLTSYASAVFLSNKAVYLKLTITWETSSVRELTTDAPCSRSINPINSKCDPWLLSFKQLSKYTLHIKQMHLIGTVTCHGNLQLNYSISHSFSNESCNGVITNSHCSNDHLKTHLCGQWQTSSIGDVVCLRFLHHYTIVHTHLLVYNKWRYLKHQQP